MGVTVTSICNESLAHSLVFREIFDDQCTSLCISNVCFIEIGNFYKKKKTNKTFVNILGFFLS